MKRLAPTFKLIGNSVILGCMEVLAEAMTMGEKSGIGQELVYEYVKGAFRSLSATLYQTHEP